MNSISLSLTESICFMWFCTTLFFFTIYSLLAFVFIQLFLCLCMCSFCITSLTCFLVFHFWFCSGRQSNFILHRRWSSPCQCQCDFSVCIVICLDYIVFVLFVCVCFNITALPFFYSIIVRNKIKKINLSARALNCFTVYVMHLTN